MDIELKPGENLIRSTPANMQRGLEAVGGKLYLTDSRILFTSHKFNFQNGPTEIALAAVDSVQLSWTRIFGMVPVFPNSFVVRAAGAEYSFVTSTREQWLKAIGAQTSASRA